MREFVSFFVNFSFPRGRPGGGGAERRGGINTAVSSDVASILKGKTHGQLRAMENQINAKIAAGDAGTDVGYWESLLQQLKAHMARVRLHHSFCAITSLTLCTPWAQLCAYIK